MSIGIAVAIPILAMGVDRFSTRRRAEKGTGPTWWGTKGRLPASLHRHWAAPAHFRSTHASDEIVALQLLGAFFLFFFSFFLFFSFFFLRLLLLLLLAAAVVRLGVGARFVLVLYMHTTSVAMVMACTSWSSPQPSRRTTTAVTHAFSSVSSHRVCH